jgi:hypothetical protein
MEVNPVYTFVLFAFLRIELELHNIKIIPSIHHVWQLFLMFPSCKKDLYTGKRE